MKLKSF